MKSRTPWLPGLRPVITLVHAGGVSGCGVESSSARTPRAAKRFMNGITPSSMSGSSTR
jgi:hypothetical protein